MPPRTNEPRPSAPRPSVLVWDLPHRLWHWALAICIVTSLVTGLSGDIDVMDLHISVGVGVIGLLLFRLGWALWGGQYVRMRQYGTSPAAIWSHLRGRGRGDAAHSAPGAAMALTTWVVLAVQVTSGLFSSDSITTDGPYARRLSSAGVEFATAIHTRTFWLVIGLIAVHVSALGWYTWRGDRIATSMWHGRRATRLAPLVRHHALRAIATAAVAAAVIAAADRWL